MSELTDIQSGSFKTIGRLSMQISARNQIQAEIVSVESQNVNAKIHLKLKSGQELVSVITKEAVENLLEQDEDPLTIGEDTNPEATEDVVEELEMKALDGESNSELEEGEIVEINLDELKEELEATSPELQEKAKPDFPDVDGDGDTTEPIAKAAKEKEEVSEEIEITEENMSKAGRQVYNLLCLSCHSIGGPFNDMALMTDGLKPGVMKYIYKQMGNKRPYMPPFVANKKEAAALTHFIFTDLKR